ncbi:MAG TPA: class F sortase [Acidimicrobiales bacterium]|nr:class F sortase [Acidimicrobiales bacterium]
MSRISRLLHRLRRRSVATFTAIVLLVGAVAVIGVALASQQRAPQPSAQQAGSVGRRSTPTEPPTSAADSAPSPTPAATTTTLPPTLGASRPVEVNIPAIGVQSPVRSLGLDSAGELQVPQPGPFYDDAAWCRCSPTPGERGPSVIIGHVDSAASGPSVFYRLGALQPGDTVSVSRDDGTTATFRVDGVRRFRKDAFPTRLVYGNTPDAQLRLITCGGPFDGSGGHYVDNIVVFATLDSPPP